MQIRVVEQTTPFSDRFTYFDNLKEALEYAKNSSLNYFIDVLDENKVVVHTIYQKDLNSWMDRKQK